MQNQMLIEQNTKYAQSLEQIDDFSFWEIRNIAKEYIEGLRDEAPNELYNNCEEDLSEDTIEELYEELNRGTNKLTSDEQMMAYLYFYGFMHETKLRYAFDELPKSFFSQPEIRIIDYGCGQAIGTMCYADFLTSRDSNQNVRFVTLIEPSETCLKRAALHVSKFFPNAEVRTLCKSFDELSATDIYNTSDTIVTLHILSNVLDIQGFDLKRFAGIIKKHISGYNQFVCVGPYFKYPPKDNRMSQFCKLMNGHIQSFRFYNKYEIFPDVTWTAQILDFFVGHLGKRYSETEATDYEIECGIKDEFGVVYSRDGKRLLKCKNWRLESYDIRNGTMVICDNAFKDCLSLEQVSIPKSVVEIGTTAFCASGYNNEKLTLQINNSSAYFNIQDSLFIDKQRNSLILCTKNLEYVTIPHSITDIRDEAFQDCTLLKHITIPDSVESIGNAAFAGCKSLRKITIPNSVNSLGLYVFDGCESLQQITISNSVKSIGNRAFENCPNLHHIFIPIDDEEKYKKVLPKDLWDKLLFSAESTKEDFINGVQDEFGVLYSKNGEKLLEGYIELKTYIVRDGTKVICDSAFYLVEFEEHRDLWTGKEYEETVCSALQQIYIPNTVTSIGNKAFQDCIHLKEITIPNSVKSIGDSTFYGCKSLQHITISDSLLNIGDYAFEDCKSLQKVIIPESIMAIGTNPFYGCKCVEVISKSPRFTVTNGLLIDNTLHIIISYIGSCDYVEIPDTITKIGDSAFKDCKSLKAIIIPNSVNSLGDSAFSGCESLHQITIPESVTHIGIFAFSGCKSLQQITLFSVKRIGFRTFGFCKSLRQIIIPYSVTEIDEGAFIDCSSLQQLAIPYSVTIIGKEAFEGCSSLEQISLPDSITNISMSAFNFCNYLEHIIISKKSVEKFKEMLPEELWDKLYCLKKAVEDEPKKDNYSSTRRIDEKDDLPF